MKKLLIVSIMLFLFLGCGSKEKNEEVDNIESVNMMNLSPPPLEDELKSDGDISNIKTNSFSETQKIIKEGNIIFQTLDLEKTKELIVRNTQNAKGYVSNEKQNKQDDKIEYSLDIRVPVIHFDEILNNISQSAENIDSRSIHVKDVTEDYQDAQIRIKNKKEIENRYRELLNKAQKVPEILSIEEKLGEIRTDIEAYEGHINYLNNQVAFSTLHISFYKKIGKSYGFSFKFIDSLSDGWSKFTNAILAIISFWPFLIIVVILYLIFKSFSKKKNDPKR